MKSSFFWRLAVLLLIQACAQRVHDRTQPAKVHKSIFDGECYSRQTVIDLPYGAHFNSDARGICSLFGDII